MKHKFWSVLLSVALAVTLAFVLKQPVSAVSSGSCGDNVRWSVSSSGVLTISGTGAMRDYQLVEGTGNAPWGADAAITQIVIREGVTYIGEYAFFQLKNVTSVTLPSTLVEIGGHSFQDQEKLTSIALPEGLEYIGSYAFSGTNSMTKITLPASITGLGSCWIGRLAELHVASLEAWLRIDFGPRDPYGQSSANPLSSGTCKLYIGGKQPTKVEIPEGTEQIKDYAFFGLDSMTSVTIPASVTHIGTGAFWSCDGLTEVTVPDTVTSLGDRLFMECSNLKKVTLPRNLTAIPDSTFRDCVSLEQFTMPAGVTSIGRCAFENCGKLKYFSEDNSLENVTYIGGYAFNRCTSLEFGHLVLSDALTYMGDDYSGYAFAYCEGLTGVTIPGSLQSVGWVAFEGCANLKTVEIGEGVQNIGSHAFAQCTALETIVLPASVTVLDRGIFYGCTALKEVHVRNGELVIPGPFELEDGTRVYPLGDPQVTTLYGHPESTAQAYAEANGFAFEELEKTCGNGYHNYAAPEGHFACSAPGTVVFTCADCGDSHEEAFRSQGHCVTDGVCELCGEEFIAAGVWGSGRAFWHIDAGGSLYVFANEPVYLEDGTLWEPYAESITRMVLAENIAGIFLVAPGDPARQPVYYPNLKTLELGAAVEGFSPDLLDAPALETVTVSPENQRLFVQDGVLYGSLTEEQLREGGYEAPAHILALYPAALEGTEFTVPGSVVWVYGRAFANAAQLTRVTFRPEAGLTVYGDPFPGCGGLTDVLVYYADAFTPNGGAVADYQNLLGDPESVTLHGVAESMTQALAEAFGYTFIPFTPCQLRDSHGEAECRDTKEATCLEPGYTGDRYCVDCGELLEEGQETELADHALVHSPEEAPGCETPGVREYWRCSVCEKLFADREASGEVEELELPALGHTWDQGTAQDREVTHTCLVCGETMSYVLPPEGMELHLPEDRTQLLDKILTDEEKLLVQQGVMAEAYLTAFDVSKSLSDGDLELLEKARENGVIGAILDIQLLKIVGSDQPQPVHTLSEKIRVRIRIPDALRDPGELVQRSFWILRLHEGVAERLDGVLDPETGYLEFETDRFSAYALVYEDTQLPEPTVPATTVPPTEEPTVPATTVPPTEAPTVPATTVPSTQEPTVPTTAPQGTTAPTQPTEGPVYGGGRNFGTILWIALEILVLSAAAAWWFLWRKKKAQTPATEETAEPAAEEAAEPVAEEATEPAAEENT